jgi:hypothetical protein
MAMAQKLAMAPEKHAECHLLLHLSEIQLGQEKDGTLVNGR